MCQICCGCRVKQLGGNFAISLVEPKFLHTLLLRAFSHLKVRTKVCGFIH